MKSLSVPREVPEFICSSKSTTGGRGGVGTGCLHSAVSHGGLQGYGGESTQPLVPGQLGDMGAPERLEERQLQAGPSAELNFTN